MEEELLKYYEESEEEVPMEELIKKAIEYVGEIIEFEEPDPDDMLDVMEEEKVQTDTYLMKQYNEGIEDKWSITGHYYESYENSIKFKFKEKEIWLGFGEDINSDASSLGYYTSDISECTFLMEVQTLKRLHIQSISYFSKNSIYENSFSDYEIYLDEYDEEYDEKYKEYFSDKLSKIKDKTSLNTEKYKLSDSDKEFLMEILITYNFPFTLTLKDGVLCLTAHFNMLDNPKETILEICKFIEFVIKIFDRFMYI